MVEPISPSSPISRKIAGSNLPSRLAVEHARKQLLLRIVARGVAHHALFLGQFAFEVERIVPFERGVLDLGAFRLVLFRFFRKLGHRRSPWLRCRSLGGRRSTAARAPRRCRSGRVSLSRRTHAPVAQLDRALPSEGRGQGFESLRARQFQSVRPPPGAGTIWGLADALILTCASADIVPPRDGGFCPLPLANATLRSVRGMDMGRRELWKRQHDRTILLLTGWSLVIAIFSYPRA